ncbi:MAG: polymer-forming cytoskeletal protein [Acidobacteria bacterium]|nr:MAG: polymer-forming cytoskeletal protein [Acidobacteriota bacterium]
MSIFRRDGSSQTPAPKPEPTPVGRPAAAAPGAPARPQAAGAQKTLVAAGSKIEGRISGSSQVLVEGIVEGEVNLEDELIIGDKGRVVGDVSARSVRISGTLKGNVSASEKVELMPSGSIEGDVVAPRVAIAEGGFCKGKIEMNPGRAAGKSSSAQAPRSLSAG